MAEPASSPGRLIAFEGLDGVGKTTQARLLARHLTSLNRPVVLTREPTDGQFGQQIRRIISQGRAGISPEAELELFIADRREHVRKIIQPGLAAGRIVISDRYYFSSMAYQGALGLDPRDIEQRHATFAPRPDLIIVLELPLPEIARRLQHRGTPASHAFEQIDYLAKVAALFDRLEAPNLVRVDGLGSEPEIQARIQLLVDRVLNLSPHTSQAPSPSCPEEA